MFLPHFSLLIIILYKFGALSVSFVDIWAHAVNVVFNHFLTYNATSENAAIVTIFVIDKLCLVSVVVGVAKL